MERFSANGAELEYETVGTGEPLILIHGVLIGDSFAPLLSEPALTSRYQVTNYHRRGYLASSPHSGPFSIAQQAADALAVIRRVAGGRAHVAGHSYGGLIALQLSLDTPGAVHSLSLLEGGRG
ncbi:MAG: alpha/beta fold hydrolase [Acidobacteriota bacterium]